jgi:xanthine dehydrogenase accessory factor
MPFGWFPSGKHPRQKRGDSLSRSERAPGASWPLGATSSPVRGERWYDRRVVKQLVILVRGVGDIGSAIGHRLFGEGYGVIISDGPEPTTTRRGMAFADAVFDGRAMLKGVQSVRTDSLEEVKAALSARRVIPVYVRDMGPLLAVLRPDVLVDARMRKHSRPEVQRGYAGLTVGLGPGLEVGRHADVVVETSWDGLGAVLTQGASLPLAGEPREIEGHARDRYRYAECDGVFRTKFHIGDVVRREQEIAEIGPTVLTAPLDGVLRGLTRDGVPVTAGTKVIEIDPRGMAADVIGITERQRRIAEGVLTAIRMHREGELGK